MKKFMFLMTFVLAFLLISCEKDIEDDFYELPPIDCDCGNIIDDEIDIINSQLVYTLTVKNNCTQVIKEVTVSETTWMNNYVGDQWCGK